MANLQQRTTLAMALMVAVFIAVLSFGRSAGPGPEASSADQLYLRVVVALDKAEADLIEQSRIEEGRAGEGETGPLDLAELVRRTTDRLGKTGPDAKVELAWDQEAQGFQITVVMRGETRTGLWRLDQGNATSKGDASGQEPGREDAQ